MKTILQICWRNIKRLCRQLLLTTWRMHAMLLRAHTDSACNGATDISTLHAAAVTVINDDFVPYFIMWLKSLLQYNPWFHFPFVVVWNPVYSPLSEESRQLIRSVYPNVQFQEADHQPYEKFLASTPAKFLAALFTLEAFNLTSYDRVVFFDADMLCLGDVSELFTTAEPLAACMTGSDMQKKEIFARIKKTNTAFNSGMMSIGKAYLSDKIYRSFFDCPYDDFADQEILNKIFQKIPLYYLPHEYNYNAKFFWDDQHRDSRVRILHYAGEKPLTHPDLPRMNIWFEHRKMLEEAGHATRQP